MYTATKPWWQDLINLKSITPTIKNIRGDSNGEKIRRGKIKNVISMKKGSWPGRRISLVPFFNTRGRPSVGAG